MQGQFLLVTSRSRRQALKSSAAPSKISASAAANGASNSSKFRSRSVACSATVMSRKRRAPFLPAAQGSRTGQGCSAGLLASASAAPGGRPPASRPQTKLKTSCSRRRRLQGDRISSFSRPMAAGSDACQAWAPKPSRTLPPAPPTPFRTTKAAASAASSSCKRRW